MIIGLVATTGIVQQIGEGVPKCAYQVILPLRLLTIEEGWKKSLTDLLMDHLEDNMEKDKENNNYWSNDVNVHVVDRIMNGMDLGNIKNKENCERQISREDIYRAVGVLETNCWEIFGNGKHGFRGIFPLVNQTPCILRRNFRYKNTPQIFRLL